MYFGPKFMEINIYILKSLEHKESENQCLHFTDANLTTIFAFQNGHHSNWYLSLENGHENANPMFSGLRNPFINL